MSTRVERPSGTPMTLDVARRNAPLAFGDLELRPAEFEALVGGRRVGLTRREFQVLYCLALEPDRVLTRQDVYDRVWGGVMPHRDRSVDVFVRKVRSKLQTIVPDAIVIHTHFGVGYRFAYETRGDVGSGVDDGS